MLRRMPHERGSTAMTSQSYIAITGAAGALAADIIPGLRSVGYAVLGIDRREPAAGLCDLSVASDITDVHEMTRVMSGATAVVHLAGIPLEDEWSEILHANIDGTRAVLEAARLAGVPRAVLASSIHVAGFVPVPEAGNPVPDDAGVAPDTYYGVSKAAVEALGSLYHDRYGLDVICLRIASRFDRPEDARMLHTWLSPDDATRLVIASLTTQDPGFRQVWGVSANTRAYLSPAGGRAIGFVPQDDAEVFVDEIDESLSTWERRYIGGDFCSGNPPRMDAAQS